MKNISSQFLGLCIQLNLEGKGRIIILVPAGMAIKRIWD